jgi:hypothetical protein
MRWRVHLPGHGHMRRLNVRRRTHLRRSADLWAVDYLQFCPDVLEYLNLSGLDNMSGDGYLCPASDMRGYPDMWWVHDLSADSWMWADVV